jgi:hypothetical protein
MSGQCPDDGLVYPDSLEVLVFAQKLHDTNINMLGTAITKNKCLNLVRLCRIGGSERFRAGLLL